MIYFGLTYLGFNDINILQQFTLLCNKLERLSLADTATHFCLKLTNTFSLLLKSAKMCLELKNTLAYCTKVQICVFGIDKPSCLSLKSAKMCLKLTNTLAYCSKVQ